MTRNFRIDDLLIEDEPEIRDARDYGPRVAALSSAHAEFVMDRIDVFGADRVRFGTPKTDGTLQVEFPTGKLHSTNTIVEIDADGNPTGVREIIPAPRPVPAHLQSRTPRA